ncbi:amino acid carrier protein [Psychroflexus sediminis]|uniref:Alanine or glycine:cation symporter, AGCS family n=1 Tax=Psychroflexus sediminis TaxID=470826 RepID=A0A1G7WI80_9FLAO|nr:amino acid carrier protein [Psychroflexus sediminis]SDG71598.1 alanine or glycine:cation symporter, AGCS family [Psychroflexus sediminis]
MVRNITLIAFLLFTIPFTFAQELQVEETVINPSDKINDAQVNLEVKGGTPPYTYQWSKNEVPLTSNTAGDLTEGILYSVKVSDAAGASVEKSFSIEPESIVETFNGTFKPVVDAMGSVLFWDPFAAIGIYDPIVYTDEKLLFSPRWEPNTESEFLLKEWLVSEDEHVEKGQDIAIVEVDGEAFTVQAEVDGEIEFLTPAGQYIYNPNNKEDIIAQNAHKFGKIIYDEPVALTNPNGTPLQKGIPFIVIWLIFGAAFFTFRMGFINLRGFKHAIQLAKGKFDEPNAPGSITHFQALATAVSATVGLGNIAGVAIAVSLGGAGATFWMILAGLLGMSSKFVECTLGVKYRFINKEGRIFGGPMNYLRYGLEKRNLGKLGKVLAGLFAVLAIGASFGGGNMFQANQSFEILSNQIPFLDSDSGFYFGIFLAILVGVVIIGGINSIAKVTGKVVPIMAGVYVIGALVVIGINIENVGPAFNAIITGAFTPTALKGGFIGVLVVGFQRAAFSNEAGVGSAAIAHSAAKTNHPPSEGFVALLEPFIDTVVVCTLTALVLIFTGMHEVDGVSGVQLTTDAFGSVISWFPYVLSIAVFLFAFSTMISWSYYGMRAWTYIFGKSNRSEIIYKVIFLFFVVLGASVSLGAVLDFSDMMILAMSFPNIIGLYIMSGEVRDDLREYMSKLKSGQIFQKEVLKK